MSHSKSQNILFKSMGKSARRAVLILATGFSVFASSALAQSSDVLEMSLEELMNVEVYSAAKKTQKILDTPAAVYVLSSDDIKHSTATSLPGLLREVPGVEVAQINASHWSVSMRGFQGQYSNKLLVMVDGRTIYNHIFSGVLWEAENIPLDSIERIEVIRGPGGTLWGANAVNGVINIITKNAKDTTGYKVSAGGGNQDRAQAEARAGFDLEQMGFLRWENYFYNKGSSHNALTGGDSVDQAGGYNSTARWDWDIDNSSTLFTSANFSLDRIDFQTFLPVPEPPFTTLQSKYQKNVQANAISRYDYKFSEDSKLSAQAFFNHQEANYLIGNFYINTYDLELQHTYRPFSRHEIVYGAGYRGITDNTGDKTVDFVPQARDLNFTNVFAQDEITLAPDELRFIAGCKLETNPYTDFEVQPNARMIWTPSQRNALWASYSRAVRTPSRYEENSRLVGAFFPVPQQPILGAASISGNEDLNSETLNAYEIGYRFVPGREWSFDLALFISDYNDLIAVQSGQPFLDSSVPPMLINPTFFDNNADGHYFGAELSVDYHPLSWWKLKGSYSFLQTHLSFGEGVSANALTRPHNDPENQFGIKSDLSLGKGVSFDSFLRFVEHFYTPQNMRINSYMELDLKLAWQFSEGWEAALIGQNLLHEYHPEYYEDIFGPIAAKIPRAVFSRVSYQF